MILGYVEEKFKTETMEMQSWFCFMQEGKENSFGFDVDLTCTVYMCYFGTQGHSCRVLYIQMFQWFSNCGL